MMILKIAAVAFLLAGFGTVLAAKNLVKLLGLEQKVKVTFEHEMDEEELAEFMFTKATVNVKIYGMLIAIPGIVLTLIAFR